jgi:hypothetical protein
VGKRLGSRGVNALHVSRAEPQVPISVDPARVRRVGSIGEALPERVELGIARCREQPAGIEAAPSSRRYVALGLGRYFVGDAACDDAGRLAQRAAQQLDGTVNAHTWARPE